MESILLVEDSKFLRMASERVLVRAGYKVFSTGDGEEALRLALERMPDLILLDLLLPKLGGPEVLRELKNNPMTARIPVVVLSSLSQQNETKLKRDGAVAYLEKSSLNFDIEGHALLEAVRKALVHA